jgi:hypothetical protein
MANLEYYLTSNNEVVSRQVSTEELEKARKVAKSSPHGLRTCWNCNPCHSRFLEDKTDNFFFTCFACGHHYINGIDITEETL